MVGRCWAGKAATKTRPRGDVDLSEVWCSGVLCKTQDLPLRTVADIVGLQREPISSAPSGIISLRTAICTDSNQPSAQNHEEVASIFTDTV